MLEIDKSIGARIKARRLELGISQEELAKRVGYETRGAINKIELGTRDISQSKLLLFAQALHMDPLDILGIEDPPHKKEKQSPYLKKIPMLGEIACGQPIFANQEYDEYVEIGHGIKADFALTARGDSMIGARIYDGDIVFCKSQPTVNNGEIAVVLIDDEVTLKKVFFYPDKQKLVLQPENSNYEPFVYIGEELREVRIIGKAIAFHSDIRYK